MNLGTKKPSHRVARMNDLYRQEIANYLIHGFKDSRIGFVTITRVKVSPDMSDARVNFTVIGSKKEADDTLKGLRASAREIRMHLAKSLNTRHTPRLEFFYDEELEEAYRMEKIFSELGTSGAR